MASKYHFIVHFSYRETSPGEVDSFMLPIMYCSKKEAVNACDDYMDHHNRNFKRKVKAYTLYQESYRNAVEPEEV